MLVETKTGENKMIDFKEMTGEDWFGFQGAECFEDDSNPLIHYFDTEIEDECGVVLLDATGLNVGFGDRAWYAFKCNKAMGKLLASVLVTDEEILISLGFENIME